MAALHVIHHLVTGFGDDDTVTRALRTRTFYVAPRVNPDGVEWVLADSPRWRRSSTRPWPWRDAHRAPGLHVGDIDGDGKILIMRVPDPNGAWMPSREDDRILRPVPIDGTPEGTTRYRMLFEGEMVDHDGFTIPTPRAPESLDMNRNFPAGWGTGVRGSGDHPLSEPEIDALVRGHRRPPEHLRVQRVPHQRRRLAAAVEHQARLGAASGRRVDLRAARRARHGAHRVHLAQRVRGLHLGHLGDDERRGRRLGLRAPRRVRLDHRVLGRGPRGHRHQAEHALLVHRPDRGRGAGRAGLGRRAPPGDVRPVAAVRPSAARSGGDRRVGRDDHVDQPAAQPARRRGPSARPVRRVPGARRAVRGGHPPAR